LCFADPVYMRHASASNRFNRGRREMLVSFGLLHLFNNRIANPFDLFSQIVIAHWFVLRFCAPRRE